MRQQMEVRAEKDHGKKSQCKVATSFCGVVHSREHPSSLANKCFLSVYYVSVNSSCYYMTTSYRPGVKKFDWFKAGL